MWIPVQTERVGGMSDIHIGAEEVVGEYADEDGNLKMAKQDVLRAMSAEKAKAAFPRSYEIETAMAMVNDKFDDNGEAKADMDMSSEQPAQEPEALEGNAFAQAVQQAKAAGLKSLSQVSDMTGQSAQTLINWSKNKSELFAVVIKGCQQIKREMKDG